MIKMEDKIGRKHTITLVDREKLSIAGVTEVFSFDEEVIELETGKGYLDIKGDGLHVIKMNIDEGEVVVEGVVDELIYHNNQGQSKKKGTIMSKLFK